MVVLFADDNDGESTRGCLAGGPLELVGVDTPPLKHTTVTSPPYRIAPVCILHRSCSSQLTLVWNSGSQSFTNQKNPGPPMKNFPGPVPEPENFLDIKKETAFYCTYKNHRV